MCIRDRYIAEQKLGTKVAIIWKNDDVYSTGIHDKFVEEAKAKGDVYKRQTRGCARSASGRRNTARSSRTAPGHRAE